jgi:predicted acyltransferase
LWCTDAPFDPEGLVSSLTASAGTSIGAHVGFVLLCLKKDTWRIRHWVGMGLLMITISLPFHYSNAQPWNTDLYTITFLLLTSGLGCLMIASFYWLIEVKKCCLTPFQPMIWVGKNAITIYLLAESGIPQWLLGIFYINGEPNDNLGNILWPTGVFWGGEVQDDHRPTEPSRNWLIVIWTIGYIAAWSIVAYWMDLKKWYIKL